MHRALLRIQYRKQECFYLVYEVHAVPRVLRTDAEITKGRASRPAALNTK